MHREILHLYGPLAINSFGLCIIIGLVIFSMLLLADPKRIKLISTDQYFNGLCLAIITGLMGGRFLYVITHWQMMESWWHPSAFWLGGFSLLGGVIALLLVMPWYLKKQKIPIISLLDLVALYAPLLQAISRVGCFFAGCCYGLPTSAVWGIPAHNGLFLHPTQLYSALALLIIFLLLYYLIRYYCTKSGQLLCVYLFLMSMERFIIDFWRAEREFLPISSWISIPQLVAIIIALGASIAWCILTFKNSKRVHP